MDANKSEIPRKVKVPNALGTGEIEINAPSYMMQDWEIEFSDTLNEDEIYE
jgi:hypothetical protein